MAIVTFQTKPAEDTLNHLHRLAQKPGVQSTLILSRETGAIVRASGLLISNNASDQSDGVNGGGANPPNEQDVDPVEGRNTRRGDDDETDNKLRSADDVARTVWKFFRAAGGMVDEMRGDGEDEVHLIRLRMRRCEVVVVPDPKYLLVVIHDTPPA